MVKRSVSIIAKVNIEEFDHEVLEEEFLLCIRNMTSLDEIS